MWIIHVNLHYTYKLMFIHGLKRYFCHALYNLHCFSSYTENNNNQYTLNIDVQFTYIHIKIYIGSKYIVNVAYGVTTKN